MHALRASIAAVVLLVPTAVSAQQLRVRGIAGTAFQRLSDEGRDGALLLGFDDQLHAKLVELHSRGEAFPLRGLPLPGNRSVDLELRPVEAMASTARALVIGADGTLSLLTPSVRCFSGTVAGGGSVFLGVTAGEMNGYLTYAGELYYLSAGEVKRPGRAVVASAALVSRGGGGVSCGASTVSRAIDDQAVPRMPIGERLIAPVLRYADIFVEADNEYRLRFASDLECLDYTVTLYTAASEVYRRDLGVRLVIPDGYLRIWNRTPPWGAITGFASLDNFYTWWQSGANALASIPRAAVQALSYPVFGGTARGTTGLCSTVRAYELASCNGRFPYPLRHTDRDNWDLFVVCHELGHTFGSVHSQDYNPPIQCVDGSGPDSGTIMSYCHTTYGMAKVGMRFHLREQQRIRSQLTTPKCLRTQALLPGDYDGDGDTDTADLVALNGVMTQGFRSSAAEEVFDLDADLDVDDADHDLLAQLVYDAPPASVAVRNGRDVNPLCLQALGNPVLGTTWTTRILASGTATPTLLVGYDGPLGGANTPRGELLVRTAPYGGVKLYSLPAISDGTASVQSIPLPMDAALFGRAVTFQGLVLDPHGEYYCNALDVVLSPYE